MSELVDEIAAIRDELWAEAVVQFRAGVPWYLDTPDLVHAAAREQDDRYQRDEWEEVIAEYVARPHVVANGWVTTGDVLEHALKLPVDAWGKSEQMRVGACLARLKWERGRIPNTRKRCYVPPKPAQVGFDVGSPSASTGEQPTPPAQPAQPIQTTQREIEADDEYGRAASSTTTHWNGGSGRVAAEVSKEIEGGVFEV